MVEVGAEDTHTVGSTDMEACMADPEPGRVVEHTEGKIHSQMAAAEVHIGSCRWLVVRKESDRRRKAMLRESFVNCYLSHYLYCMMHLKIVTILKMMLSMPHVCCLAGPDSQAQTTRSRWVPQS